MDKGGVVEVVLGKLGKQKPGAGDADEGDALGMAAEELLAAVESKDASRVASALRGAVQTCMDEYGGDE